MPPIRRGELLSAIRKAEAHAMLGLRPVMRIADETHDAGPGADAHQQPIERGEQRVLGQVVEVVADADVESRVEEEEVASYEAQQRGIVERRREEALDRNITGRSMDEHVDHQEPPPQ